VVSVALSAVAMASSLLLLWAALDSGNPEGVFQSWFGLPAMPYAHIITLIYLKVSISDFLTLFSARTHNGFFWSQRPGWILLVAAVCALATSTILGCLWPMSSPDDVETAGLLIPVEGFEKYSLWPLWTWIYCIIWWFIQDAIKVVVYAIMRK